MARATRSFPAPVSPRIRTVKLVLATRLTSAIKRAMPLLGPMDSRSEAASSTWQDRVRSLRLSLRSFKARKTTRSTSWCLRGFSR